MVRIGVYICHCGVNIASSVDVEKVTKVMKATPGVAAAQELSLHVFGPGSGIN